MATLRKRNDKWQALVRKVGHQPRTKSFSIRADALRWIRDTELELERAVFAYDPAVLERTTVEQLLRRYADEITRFKRGSDIEAIRIETFLRQPWAACSLARLSSQTFSQFRDSRLKLVGAGTVIRELGLLHAIFQVARHEWDIPLQENPIARVRKPKAPAGRERRLLPQEQAAILAACADCRNDWLEPAVLLAIETGMRRGEILNIRCRDVDLDNGLLRIPETKTGIPRTIPLTEKAVAILAARHGAKMKLDTELFAVSANAFRLAWERCKRRAARQVGSVENLRFHDLRHEAVSRFFELGLSVPEVAAISGHKDPRMLFRYTHLKPLDIAAKLRAPERSLQHEHESFAHARLCSQPD